MENNETISESCYGSDISGEQPALVQVKKSETTDGSRRGSGMMGVQPVGYMDCVTCF